MVTIIKGAQVSPSGVPGPNTIAREAIGGGGGGTLPLGTSIFYVVNGAPPDGWLDADGSEISRTDYADYYALVGDLYGEGDGSTTFNLPDTTGRVAIGIGASRILGEIGGEETHVLSIAEMPIHTHVQNTHTHIQNTHGHEGYLAGQGAVSSWALSYSAAGQLSGQLWISNVIATNQNTVATNQNTGGGLAHNNMQPYITWRYIVKVLLDDSGSGNTGDIPIADTEFDGLLRKVSGLTTDFIDGTNNSRDLASAIAELGGGSASVEGGNPIGTIIQFAGIGDVPNYLETDGSEVDRVIYSELFAVLGETYGPGDGSTTFNLPDARGRVPLGVSPDYSLGSIGGEASHVLSISEMPVHTHIQNAHTHIQNSHNHSIYAYAASPGGGTFRVMEMSISPDALIQAATAVNQNTTATNQNTGGGIAHNNLQPYIALRYLIKASSDGGSGSGSGASVSESLPIGSSILYTAEGNPPNGWMVCDGAEVSRTSYAEYFALVGELYGVGDGSTTFNLPNTIGRFIVAGGSGRSIGDIGGEETHILTIAEMPSHTHVQNSHTHDVGAMQGTAAGGGYAVGMGGTGGLGWTIPGSIAINQNTGGGIAHNNLPPYMVWNYIVKVKTVGSVPADAPIADDTQDGLLRKVSGLDTDFVDGTNNCQDLALFLEELGITDLGFTPLNKAGDTSTGNFRFNSPSQIIIESDQGLAALAYSTAKLSLIAPNTSARPGIGFTNPGTNGVFLFLDTDNKMKFIDGGGAVHIITSS